MPACDYAGVADIYDDFCVFDADIGFFRDSERSAFARESISCCGAVFERMNP
ncbi:MAG: hypothetical protein PVG92_08165 [Holophagae bacterium]|jgi:hypothetical protein